MINKVKLILKSAGMMLFACSLYACFSDYENPWIVLENYPSGWVVDESVSEIVIKGEVGGGTADVNSLWACVEGEGVEKVISFDPSSKQFSYTVDLDAWGSDDMKTISLRVVDANSISYTERITIFRGKYNLGPDSAVIPVNIGEQFFNVEIGNYIVKEMNLMLSEIKAGDFTEDGREIQELNIGTPSAAVTLIERTPLDPESGIALELQINNFYLNGIDEDAVIYFDVEWEIEVKTIYLSDISTSLFLDENNELVVTLDFTEASVQFSGVKTHTETSYGGVDIPETMAEIELQVITEYTSTVRDLSVKEYSGIVNVEQAFETQGLEVEIKPEIINVEDNNTISYSVQKVELSFSPYYFVNIPLNFSVDIPEGYYSENLTRYLRGSQCPNASPLPLDYDGYYDYTDGEDIISPITEGNLNGLSFYLFQSGSWAQIPVEATDEIKDTLGKGVVISVTITSPPVIDLEEKNHNGSSRLIVNNLMVEIMDASFNVLLSSVDAGIGIDLDISFYMSVNNDGSKFVFNVDRENSRCEFKILYANIRGAFLTYAMVENLLQESSSMVFDIAYDVVNEFMPSLADVNIDAMDGMFDPIRFVYSKVHVSDSSQCFTPVDRLFIKLGLGKTVDFIPHDGDSIPAGDENINDDDDSGCFIFTISG